MEMCCKLGREDNSSGAGHPGPLESRIRGGKSSEKTERTAYCFCEEDMMVVVVVSLILQQVEECRATSSKEREGCGGKH